jgi:hypothetical protein
MHCNLRLLNNHCNMIAGVQMHALQQSNIRVPKIKLFIAPIMQRLPTVLQILVRPAATLEAATCTTVDNNQSSHESSPGAPNRMLLYVTN